MGLFRSKSKKELAAGYAVAALTSAGAKRVSKVAGGALAGLLSVTVASAAISAARHQGE